MLGFSVHDDALDIVRIRGVRNGFTQQPIDVYKSLVLSSVLYIAQTGRLSEVHLIPQHLVPLPFDPLWSDKQAEQAQLRHRANYDARRYNESGVLSFTYDATLQRYRSIL